MFQSLFWLFCKIVTFTVAIGSIISHHHAPRNTVQSPTDSCLYLLSPLPPFDTHFLLLCNFGTIAHARLHFAVADKQDFNQSMQGALNGRTIRAAASTISYDLQIGYSQATDQARVLTRKFITLKKHSTWKLTPSFRTLRDAAWLRLRLAIISRGEQVRVGSDRGWSKQMTHKQKI